MPQSLRRTWVALAVAALAVFVVAVLVGRDFTRDVVPTCSTSLVPTMFGEFVPESSLTPEALETTEPVPSMPRWLQLRFDQKTDSRTYAPVTQYANVRIVLNDIGLDGKSCACGSIPIALSGETPSDLRLYRVVGREQYVVKGRATSELRSDLRAAFIIQHGPARHVQLDRIFTAGQLPALVAWLALGALGVALVRARRAVAYALRLHAWTEARLTPEGLLEGDSGETLGTLAPQSWATRIPDGPVLVAPSALSRAGLYRDMPVVQRRDVAEGTHARWASGTMLRLRDARALAAVSTACALLGLLARLLA